MDWFGGVHMFFNAHIDGGTWIGLRTGYLELMLRIDWKDSDRLDMNTSFPATNRSLTTI